jgi:putative ABC transport system ATP-binding protein
MDFNRAFTGTWTDNVAVVLQLAGWDATAARQAIARALANRPRIILADEFAPALGLKRAGIVMGLLHKLAMEQEAAINPVTHNERIFDRFDQIFRLSGGRLESGESDL